MSFLTPSPTSIIRFLTSVSDSYILPVADHVNHEPYVEGLEKAWGAPHGYAKPPKEDVASPITSPACPTEIHVVGQKDFNQDTAVRLIAELIATIYFFDLLVLRI
jgi:hypothetical protein